MCPVLHLCTCPAVPCPALLSKWVRLCPGLSAVMTLPNNPRPPPPPIPLTVLLYLLLCLTSANPWLVPVCSSLVCCCKATILKGASDKAPFWQHQQAQTAVATHVTCVMPELTEAALLATVSTDAGALPQLAARAIHLTLPLAPAHHKPHLEGVTDDSNQARLSSSNSPKWIMCLGP